MKIFVFKKQFVGNRFVQVLDEEERKRLDSDDFYNKLEIADESEYKAIVYVPIMLGTAEQVSDEFMAWLEDLGKGVATPV